MIKYWHSEINFVLEQDTDAKHSPIFLIDEYTAFVFKNEYLSSVNLVASRASVY